MSYKSKRVVEAKDRAYSRDAKKIVIDRLYAAWCQCTGMRLGQLLANAAGNELFYVEDEDLAKVVEKYVSQDIGTN